MTAAIAIIAISYLSHLYIFPHISSVAWFPPGDGGVGTGDRCNLGAVYWYCSAGHTHGSSISGKREEFLSKHYAVKLLYSHISGIDDILHHYKI